MPSVSLFSDTELLARVAAVVQAERIVSADVVEHLMEVERRRLYLDQACSSLYTYCRERLGYTEDAALKRARVARLAFRLPRVLDDLRTGAIHLTGLFLLDRYLNDENAAELLAEARGKSRRELEKLLAIRFPRPDVPSSIEALGATPTLALDVEASGGRLSSSGPSRGFACPETGTEAPTARGGEPCGDSRSRVEPLSAERYRVEFTASAALRAKLEQARELTSHALPNGDLALVFERALDELIERELKRRVGAGKPRRGVKLRPGSRHVPLAVAKQVWERDGSQCTFVDPAGRRCQERRFLTLEHCHPFSLGGAPTVENLCLLCKAHNAHAARRVFGDAFVESRLAAREALVTRVDDVAGGQTSVRQSPTGSDAFAKVRSALIHMGFCQRTVASALLRLHREQPGLELEPLLRAALKLLTPPPSSPRWPGPLASTFAISRA
jgi:hypothetical protein